MRIALDCFQGEEGDQIGDGKVLLYRCPHHGLIDGGHYSREREWGQEDGCPLLTSYEEECGEEVERVHVAAVTLPAGEGLSEEDLGELRAIANWLAQTGSIYGRDYAVCEIHVQRRADRIPQARSFEETWGPAPHIHDGRDDL